VIPWLKKRDIGLRVWETPGYLPQPPRDLTRSALHNFVLEILGVHILDRADLEALGEAAAMRNRCEFMLTMAPVRTILILLSFCLQTGDVEISKSGKGDSLGVV
jgi:hypothetical protein